MKRLRAEGDVSSPVKSTYDPDCRECHLRFRDPSPDQLIMYLHALRYQVSCTYDSYSQNFGKVASSPFVNVDRVSDCVALGHDDDSQKTEIDRMAKNIGKPGGKLLENLVVILCLYDVISHCFSVNYRPVRTFCRLAF